MAKPHAKLRGALVAADIDSRYLARRLGRGSAYISQRMMGHEPWGIDECYKILDLLKLPHSMLPELFPPQGVA